MDDQIRCLCISTVFLGDFFIRFRFDIIQIECDILKNNSFKARRHIHLSIGLLIFLPISFLAESAFRASQFKPIFLKPSYW